MEYHAGSSANGRSGMPARGRRTSNRRHQRPCQFAVTGRRYSIVQRTLRFAQQRRSRCNPLATAAPELTADLNIPLRPGEFLGRAAYRGPHPSSIQYRWCHRVAKDPRSYALDGPRVTWPVSTRIDGSAIPAIMPEIVMNSIAKPRACLHERFLADHLLNGHTRDTTVIVIVSFCARRDPSFRAQCFSTVHLDRVICFVAPLARPASWRMAPLLCDTRGGGRRKSVGPGACSGAAATTDRQYTS